MATQKALWLPKIGAELTLGTNTVPSPGPGEVLVKLEASAINPLDVDILKSGFVEIKEYPVILGEEAAGVVQKVGEGVTSLAQGDRVINAPYRCFQTIWENDHTSFQEYCLADAVLVTKIPPNLSFDQAASVPVAFVPFAVATYAKHPQGIGLTPPFNRDGLGKYANCAIAIFGGSSSLGQFAIQLARLSGFSPIITTASPHNEALLLSLGATHVLDRHLPNSTLQARIRAITGPLSYIFDAVSIQETQQAAFDLLAPGGTLAVVLQPLVAEESGRHVLYVWGTFHPSPNRKLGAQFSVALTTWLADGTIKSNHVEVLPGGLNAVAGGIKRLASGGISAAKLVVRPPETESWDGAAILRRHVS